MKKTIYFLIVSLLTMIGLIGLASAVADSITLNLDKTGVSTAITGTLKMNFTVAGEGNWSNATYYGRSNSLLTPNGSWTIINQTWIDGQAADCWANNTNNSGARGCVGTMDTNGFAETTFFELYVMAMNASGNSSKPGNAINSSTLTARIIDNNDPVCTWTTSLSDTSIIDQGQKWEAVISNASNAFIYFGANKYEMTKEHKTDFISNYSITFNPNEPPEYGYSDVYVWATDITDEAECTSYNIIIDDGEGPRVGKWIGAIEGEKQKQGKQLGGLAIVVLIVVVWYYYSKSSKKR